MIFRAGIVGCGEIAVRHARTYKELGGVELSAVTDVDPRAAGRLSGQTGAKVYPDAGSLLAGARLDFLDVCSPPAFHRAPVVAALRRGLPVICEKPLAASARDARAMVAAADRARRPLMTAFAFRFHPGVRKLRALVASGLIGRPLMYRNRFAWRKHGWEGTWRADRRIAGGGLLWDMGVHAVDLFRFLCGEIKSVQGRHGVQAPVLRARGRAAVEDSYVLAVESKSGILGTLEGSFYLPVAESLLTVYGDKGTLTLRFFGPERLELERPGKRQRGSRARAGTGSGVERVPVPALGMFRAELGHWLSVLRGKERLSVTGRDGLEAVRIVESLS